MTKTRQVVDFRQIMYKSKLRLDYIIDEIRQSIVQRFNSLGYDNTEVTDVLILYLFGGTDSANKCLLWYCYGDIIVNNLKKNLRQYYKPQKEVKCVECGEWFYASKNNVLLCPTCRDKKRQKYLKNYRKNINNKQP